MNDEFLYRLRETPPREFELQLKARLDRQSLRRFRVRSRYLHGLGIAFLLGGVAYAITTATLRDWVSADVEPHAVSTASPDAPYPADDGAGEATASAAPRAIGQADVGRETSNGEATASAASSPVRTGNERQDGGGAEDLQPTVRMRPRAVGVTRGGSLRDQLRVVGTPATRLYSEAALQFFERYDLPAAALEIQPERDALTRFCNVVEGTHADVLVTFTRMGPDRLGFCDRNWVRMVPHPREHIVELEVGYEAFVLARSVLYGSVALPLRAIFLALAREVPDTRGLPDLVENPYRAWYEIDPRLPYDRIELIGPPLDSAAAQRSLAAVMEPACATMPLLAGLEQGNPRRYAEICLTVRTDGVYDEIATKDLISRLETYPTVFGVLSYDSFARNRSNVAAAAIDGVAPTPATFADGKYPASRTLYLYVNEARVRARATPGIAQLVAAYLQLPQTRALVPLDEAKRREMQAKAAELGGKR